MEFRPGPPQDAVVEDEATRLRLQAVEGVWRGRCKDALLWERYLYEDHTRRQLSAWAKRLECFRFCRAYGGHGGDGDQLVCVLRLGDEASLLAMCAALGVGLRPMPSAEVLAGMSAGERPSSAQEFAGWVQPGWVEIQGVRVFAWIGVHLLKDESGTLTGERLSTLKLSIMDRDDVWSVTEAAVADALLVEAVLKPLLGQVVDPPQDDRNCISPKRYPEMFGLWTRETAQWPWDEPAPR